MIEDIKLDLDVAYDIISQIVLAFRKVQNINIENLPIKIDEINKIISLLPKIIQNFELKGINRKFINFEALQKIIFEF